MLTIGGLMVSMLVVISRGIGGAASDAAMANTAHTVGGKVLRAQQMDAPTATLRLQVPLGSGSPPAQIVLSGTGFQPNEQVRLAGTLSGQTGGGHVASVPLALLHPLPNGEVRATSAGDLLTVILAIPDSSRFFGRYHVQVLASGDRGSRAPFAVTAGGMPASNP